MWVLGVVRSSAQVPCAISWRQVITTPAGKTGERLVHQAERRAGVRHLRERKNDTLHMS